MPRIYTKKSEQEKRRRLRNNMTKAEVLLWLELKSRKLGFRFLRQYSISSYVIDFYCPALKLAIEVDGPTHCTEEEIEYDKYRQTAIENLNIEFLRFTNNDIYDNLASVIEIVKNKLTAKKL